MFVALHFAFDKTCGILACNVNANMLFTIYSQLEAHQLAGRITKKFINSCYSLGALKP